MNATARRPPKPASSEALPYDLITFDCYGTLIDWERGMAEAFRRIGRDTGASVDARAMVRRYVQLELGLEQGPYKAYREIQRLVLAALFRERGVTLSAARASALSRGLPAWKPFPEVPGVLKRLRAAGYRLGVLSNIDDDLLARSIRRLGVEFDYVVTAQGVRSYKPSVRHWQKVLALSKLPKKRVLHVGASLVHDMIPAKTLGLSSVWINRNAERGLPGAAPRKVFPDLNGLGAMLVPSR